MPWYEIFNPVFFITVITIISGSFALILKYCLKSKCDSVKCCYGLLEIHRNVEIETDEIKTEEEQI